MKVKISGKLVNDSFDVNSPSIELNDIFYIKIDKKNRLTCMLRNGKLIFVDVTKEVIQNIDNLIRCYIPNWAIIKKLDALDNTYYISRRKAKLSNPKFPFLNLTFGNQSLSIELKDVDTYDSYAMLFE